MAHNKSNPLERSQRQLRVGEQLRHAIIETLQRGKFHDQVLLDAQEITVTEVRVSPDLKNATAFAMSLGGKDMDQILPALNNNAHYFQKEISQKLTLKFTPRITFKYDETYGEATRIENLLRKIEQEKK